MIDASLYRDRSDTSKIQSAIDKAAKSRDRRVYIPGYYTLEDTIYVRAHGILIEGNGVLGSVLRRHGDYGPTLHVEADGGGVLYGFNLRYIMIRQESKPQTAQSVAHIHMVNASDGELVRVRADGGYRNLLMEGCSNSHVIRCNFRARPFMSEEPDFDSGHIDIGRSELRNVGTIFIRGGDCHDDYHGDIENGWNGQHSHYSYALRLRSNDGLWVDEHHFGSARIANVLIAADDTVSFAKFGGCYFDSNDGSNFRIMKETGGNGVGGVQIQGGWMRNARVDGLTVDEGATVRLLRVSDADIHSYKRMGINQQSANVKGLQIKDNNLWPDYQLGEHGIYIHPDTKAWQERGNIEVGKHQKEFINAPPRSAEVMGDLRVHGKMEAAGFVLSDVPMGWP